MTAQPPDTGMGGRLGRWFGSPVFGRRADNLPELVDLRIDPAHPLFVTTFPEVPGPARFVLALRERVSRMHREGAIDEGTPDVMDGLIEATASGRRVRIRMEHQERRFLATQSLVAVEARVSDRERRVTLLQSKLSRIEDEFDAVQIRGATDLGAPEGSGPP